MRVAWLKDLRLADLPQVGGKNASLGEMTAALSNAGIRVPGGFATTADAFREFLSANKLGERIDGRLKGLNTSDVAALAACGKEIRSWIEKAPFPADLEREIQSYYQKLESQTSGDTSFAVRSSATAEDLPEASFAGQQETFLNIRGADNVLTAIRHVYASLYNDRAISYRVHQGFAHADVALSGAVQKMVVGASAEAGKSTKTVDVPEAERHRFSLTDTEVLELARYAVAIERHYGRPMDVEWGKDGNDGKLYILQARPETVKSRKREVE